MICSFAIAFAAIVSAGPPKAPLTAAEIAWLNDFLGPEVTTTDGRRVNASAEYWTGIVGVAFDRDIDLNIPETPIDLNLDRHPDLIFADRWQLKGGVLANPEVAGLVPTPNDPKGKVGLFSISTGFLGVREEMDRRTRKGTGRYGFNCWYCHATVDDDGAILYGTPNTNIHLGLILASSRAMDDSHLIRRPGSDKPISESELIAAEGLTKEFKFDTNGDNAVSIEEWRRTMKLPPIRITQSLMLLEGPGRLDQSVDARMDGFIPLANLQHYWREKWGDTKYVATAKSPKYTVFNPVSIPSSLSGLGVSHYSWMGKDSSFKADPVAEVTSKMHISAEKLARLVGVSFDDRVDYEILSRAMTLDFRNVGTFGRESDSNAGNHWPEFVMQKPSKDALSRVPKMYGADRIRSLLTRHDWPAHGDANDPLIAEGLRIFTDRETGRILNQRIVFGREAQVPADARTRTAVVPLDRSRVMTDTIGVRCATCHNHSPGRLARPMPKPIDAMLRCDNCHFDHPLVDEPDSFVPLARHMKTQSIQTFDGCLSCHETHPEFGPQVYSNSWLLPFDADGDGITHGDEADDLRAGGIGTDAHLNLDSIFAQQLLPPDRRRHRETYVVSPNARKVPDKLEYSRMGFGFVRVAPLLTLRRTAPYLHNGSVPTLDDLLRPSGERTKRFRVGLPAQRFTLDTSLPGNGNMGHEFGTDLTADERAALIRFLQSLP